MPATRRVYRSSSRLSTAVAASCAIQHSATAPTTASGMGVLCECCTLSTGGVASTAPMPCVARCTETTRPIERRHRAAPAPAPRPGRVCTTGSPCTVCSRRVRRSTRREAEAASSSHISRATRLQTSGLSKPPEARQPRKTVDELEERVTPLPLVEVRRRRHSAALGHHHHARAAHHRHLGAALPAAASLGATAVAAATAAAAEAAATGFRLARRLLSTHLGHCRHSLPAARFVARLAARLEPLPLELAPALLLQATLLPEHSLLLPHPPQQLRRARRRARRHGCRMVGPRQRVHGLAHRLLGVAQLGAPVQRLLPAVVRRLEGRRHGVAMVEGDALLLVQPRVGRLSDGLRQPRRRLGRLHRRRRRRCRRDLLREVARPPLLLCDGLLRGEGRVARLVAILGEVGLRNRRRRHQLDLRHAAAHTALDAELAAAAEGEVGAPVIVYGPRRGEEDGLCCGVVERGLLPARRRERGARIDQRAVCLVELTHGRSLGLRRRLAHVERCHTRLRLGSEPLQLRFRCEGSRPLERPQPRLRLEQLLDG
eukprot:scaffold59850_cov60-Phaeocystis_antarctica.AAC.2